MKRVYSSEDTMFLGNLRNILENEGIACEIRGEHLLGAIGEFTPNECWAQLWILEDGQHERALEIIKSALRVDEQEKVADWKCKSCGEEIKAQFIECWRCGGGEYD